MLNIRKMFSITENTFSDRVYIDAKDFEEWNETSLYVHGFYLSLIEKYIKPGKLIDIGCGNGHLMKAALNRDWKERAEWKAEMLRFHDTQHQRNLRTHGHGFDERIPDNNKQIAHDLSIDAEYAEAFEVETFG